MFAFDADDCVIQKVIYNCKRGLNFSWNIKRIHQSNTNYHTLMNNHVTMDEPLPCLHQLTRYYANKRLCVFIWWRMSGFIWFWFFEGATHIDEIFLQHFFLSFSRVHCLLPLNVWKKLSGQPTFITMYTLDIIAEDLSTSQPQNWSQMEQLLFSLIAYLYFQLVNDNNFCTSYITKYLNHYFIEAFLHKFGKTVKPISFQPYYPA